MQNSLNPINKPVAYPHGLFVDEKGKYALGKIMTCQMDGDSMQPTIEPYEIVAVVGCGNEIKTEGIYAYSCFFWGKECLFIKRVIPLGGGALRIIHDNPHYLTFDFSPEEASQLTIHGKVVASMKVQRFV